LLRKEGVAVKVGKNKALLAERVANRAVGDLNTYRCPIIFVSRFF
jgi:hypothetical protein